MIDLEEIDEVLAGIVPAVTCRSFEEMRSDVHRRRRRSKTISAGFGVLLLIAGGWAANAYFVEPSQQVVLAGDSTFDVDPAEVVPTGQTAILAIAVSDDSELQALVDSCDGRPEVSVESDGADGSLELTAVTTQPWTPAIGCADLVEVQQSNELEDLSIHPAISDDTSGNAFFKFEAQTSSLSLRFDTIERLEEFRPDGIWEVAIPEASGPLGSATARIALEYRDGFASVCVPDESLPTLGCLQITAGLGEVLLETEVLRFLANFGSVEVAGDEEEMTWQYNGLVLRLKKL